jgi:quercetin dioxygenase-like cupin family protein
MADYTLKNLQEDVPNMAADQDLDMEARFGRSHIDSRYLGVSLFRFEPNFRMPFGHKHTEQEEAYVVVSGSGRARVEDETVELGPWDVLRLAPTTVRCLEAGPDGMELLAIGSDRTGDDAEMIQDFWPAG